MLAFAGPEGGGEVIPPTDGKETTDPKAQLNKKITAIYASMKTATPEERSALRAQLIKVKSDYRNSAANPAPPAPPVAPVPAVSVVPVAPTPAPTPIVRPPLAPTVTPTVNPVPRAPEIPTDAVLDAKKARTDAATTRYQEALTDPRATDIGIINDLRAAANDEMTALGIAIDALTRQPNRTAEQNDRLRNVRERRDGVYYLYNQAKLHLTLLESMRLSSQTAARQEEFNRVKLSSAAEQRPALDALIRAANEEIKALGQLSLNADVMINGLSYKTAMGQTVESRIGQLTSLIQDSRDRILDPNRARREEVGTRWLIERNEYTKVTDSSGTYWKQRITLLKGFPPRFSFRGGLWHIDNSGGNNPSDIVPVGASTRTGYGAEEANKAIKRLQQLNNNIF